MTQLKEEYTSFLQWMADRKTSIHSIKSHKSTVGLFIGWITQFHHIYTPNKITTDHLHAYQKHLANARTKKGMPLKPTTINKRINGARAYLGYLHDRGLISRPLGDQLHYVKEPQVLPTTVLTHTQVKQLIRVIDTTTSAGIRDRAIIELLYSTGIRIGELETLTLDALYLDTRTLKVTGKGQKERLVPIGVTATRHLTSYIRGARPFLNRHRTPHPGTPSPSSALNPSQTQVSDFIPQPSGEAVFLNADGNPLKAHRIRDHLHRYARKAQLDINITPHTFRRTCTTEMIRADANLYHVKELLGHETLGTLKHYIKLNINDLRKTHRACHPREKDHS